MTPPNIVLGERVRRPRMAAVGAAAVVLGLGFLGLTSVGVLRQIDWYRLRPAQWVVEDLRSASYGTSYRAWQELMRWAREDTLTPAVYGEIAELALEEQASETPRPLADDMVQWLGQAVQDGRLSQQQQDRFFRQAVRLTVRVRPTVVLRDPVTYQVSEYGQVPSQGWWVSTEPVGVSLDGKPVRRPGGGSNFSGARAAGSTTSSLTVEELGPHTVSATVRARIFHGPRFGQPDDPANRLLYQVELKGSAPFEVVAAESEGYVKPLRRPDLEALVRASVQPGAFYRGKRPGNLNGTLKVRSAPANLAFDVIARVGDTEYPLSSLTIPAGTSTTYHLTTNTFRKGRASRFDLVLRASRKAALRTVDLNDYWDGELVFKGLPVKESKVP